MQLKRSKPAPPWLPAGFFMSIDSVTVLKLGSSVLRDAGCLPQALEEIRRHTNKGDRVLAVVSAFEGVTDRLFREAEVAVGSLSPDAVASYVATGELQSAALLTGALVAGGLRARMIEPREVSLRVDGDSLNAEPVSIDRAAIHAMFVQNSALVLPGFFGIDSDRRTALLGRGGSDFSALFLAQQLGAQCHLIKDVPGIFDRDPAVAGNNARRFERLDWRTAREVAGKLVQPKALRFAETHRLAFSVGAFASTDETHVGDFTPEFVTTAKVPRSGTVG
jgi:homoserine dehydrogenase